MLKTWLETLLSAIGAALLAFLSSVITARVLGPEGRGLLAAAMLLANLSASVAQLGLGPAYVYHKRVHGHWRWDILLGAAGIVIVIIAASLTLLARAATTKGAEFSATTLALLASAVAMMSLLLSLSQEEATLRTHNLVKVFAPTSALLGLILVWQADQLNVQNALWIQLGANTATVAILLQWLIKELVRQRNFSSETALLEQVTAYARHALKLHATAILGLALNNIDKVYLYLIGSIRDFGLYSVAFTTSRLLGTFQETLSTTLYTRFAGQNDKHATNSVQLAFRLTLVPLLLLGSIAGLFGTLALEIIFGKAFAPAGLILAILLIECIIANSSWLLTQEFNAAGKPGLVFLRQAVSAIPVLALLPFIPASNPLIWIASLLLLSSTIRLAVTLLLYRFSLHQPIPKLLPTRVDLILILNIIKNTKNHSTRQQ